MQEKIREEPGKEGDDDNNPEVHRNSDSSRTFTFSESNSGTLSSKLKA